MTADLEGRVAFLEASVASWVELLCAQAREVSQLRSGMTAMHLIAQRLAERGLLSEDERAELAWLIDGD